MTKVDSKYRKQVIDHLQQLSELKYMKAGQQAHIEDLIDQAIELLHIVEPAPTAIPKDSPAT